MLLDIRTKFDPDSCSSKNRLHAHTGEYGSSPWLGSNLDWLDQSTNRSIESLGHAQILLKLALVRLILPMHKFNLPTFGPDPWHPTLLVPLGRWNQPR